MALAAPNQLQRLNNSPTKSRYPQKNSATHRKLITTHALTPLSWVPLLGHYSQALLNLIEFHLVGPQWYQCGQHIWPGPSCRFWSLLSLAQANELIKSVSDSWHAIHHSALAFPFWLAFACVRLVPERMVGLMNNETGMGSLEPERNIGQNKLSYQLSGTRTSDDLGGVFCWSVKYICVCCKMCQVFGHILHSSICSRWQMCMCVSSSHTCRATFCGGVTRSLGPARSRSYAAHSGHEHDK